MFDYSNKVDEKLKMQFKNIFKFSNSGINKFCFKFIFLGVYSHEYMGE